VLIESPFDIESFESTSSDSDGTDEWPSLGTFDSSLDSTENNWSSPIIFTESSETHSHLTDDTILSSFASVFDDPDHDIDQIARHWRRLTLLRNAPS
jgi:hypothetical protein